jgi:hypothetical protein
MALRASLEVRALAVGRASGLLGFVLVSGALEKSRALTISERGRWFGLEVAVSTTTVSTADAIRSLRGLGLFVLSATAPGDRMAYAIGGFRCSGHFVFRTTASGCSQAPDTVTAHGVLEVTGTAWTALATRRAVVSVPVLTDGAGLEAQALAVGGLRGLLVFELG